MKRITQRSWRVYYSEYLVTRIYVSPFFLPIFRCESWFIVKIFRNRKFSILRISCSRYGRFYFRLRTDQACAEQPELQDFCGRDLMSPESFWRYPAEQKAWRLWVLDWNQVYNIWSKKKERAEKKRGKVEARSLWKQEKKSMPYFHFERDIFGIPQLETVDCETLHLFTSKIDKACEWTYNCLIGQYLSTNGLFGAIIGVAVSYVFSWIWPCNRY